MSNLRELELEREMNSKEASIFDLSPSEKLQGGRPVGRPCGDARGGPGPRLAKTGAGTQKSESPEKPCLRLDVGRRASTGS